MIVLCAFWGFLFYFSLAIQFGAIFYVEYFVIILQGFCPGLNHGQKFGILYAYPTDERHDYETNQVQQKESTTAVQLQSHSVLVLRDQSSDNLLPEDNSSNHNDSQTNESSDTP